MVAGTTGSPNGLRGLQAKRGADDPMNLIRVMPAEEFVALPCGAQAPSPRRFGDEEIAFMIQP